MTQQTRPSSPPPERYGPYLNPDGDEFYLPVDSWTWNAARREAAMMARDVDSLASSVYVGKLSIPLHDHDEPWEEDDCEDVLCYVFEVSDA